jgi:hypothetical protein
MPRGSNHAEHYKLLLLLHMKALLLLLSLHSSFMKHTNMMIGLKQSVAC